MQFGFALRATSAPSLSVLSPHPLHRRGGGKRRRERASITRSLRDQGKWGWASSLLPPPWGTGEGQRVVYSPITVATTSRPLGRLSRLITTICCHVPSCSRPSTTGTDRPVLRSAERTWEKPLPSPHLALCS